MTPREAKCSRDSFRRAGQLALMQRLAALALLAHHLAAAHGTVRRQAEGLAVRALGRDADDFGNDVAGALHHHLVANLQAEALDLILVVERGAGNRNAAHFHRSQMGHRCQRSGAAHLHLDGFHRGGSLARRILISDGPARRFGGEAELALLLHRIHLHDDAVDFVRQAFALAPPRYSQSSMTSSMVRQILLCGLTLKPRCRSSSSEPQWVSNAGLPSISRK